MPNQALSTVDTNVSSFALKAPDTASKIPLFRKKEFSENKSQPTKRDSNFGTCHVGHEPVNFKRPRLDAKSKGNLRRSISMVSMDKLHINGRKNDTLEGRPKPAGVAKPVIHNATSMQSLLKESVGPQSKVGMTSRQPKPPNASSKTVAVVTKSGKVPSWDLKGRLEASETSMRSMKAKNDELVRQQSEYDKRLQLLETQAQHHENLLHAKASDMQKNTAELERLQNKLRQRDETIETLQYQTTCLTHERDSALQKCRSLEASLSQLVANKAAFEIELQTCKMEIENKSQLLLSKTAVIESLQSTINAKDNTITSLQNNVAQYEAKIREDEMHRRTLHNTIQELKGNIRVYCRVRPLINKETAADHYLGFPDSDDRKLEINSIDSGKGRGTGKYEFSFDRVFRPSASQQDVFGEIAQLVQSALDGYNVCIFAYGQTGSGKTFTMEGPESSLNDASQAGMITRAVTQIFHTIAELKNQSWSYSIEATFLEVYNEVIRDLLIDNSAPSEQKLEIKKNKNNDIYVTNATHVTIESEERILQLLLQARKNRAVAATNCNDRSSRSHSIFQLNLRGVNNVSGHKCIGNLHLVDLAGSERLKDSLSQGDRLKEAKHINKSLSTLGMVIMALAQKSDHIPYRSSKLTYLLMNSLGGNSKTLMFVNISPKDDTMNETLNSLRFAVQVNQCHIGTAVKRIN